MNNKKAIFSPGPSYYDPQVKKYAGWWHILELYKTTLEELFDEVFIPEVPSNLIDAQTTVSKITSYDLVAASQLPLDADLFMGVPGYSLAQMMRLKAARGKETRLITWTWSNPDWRRDVMLAPEYKRFNAFFDPSPTWRWINTTALKFCDHLIVNCRFVRDTHLSIMPKNKISIAFWGVDSQKFTPAVEEPLGFRILFVGSDPVRKGLFYLLRAFRDWFTGAELWMVGCEPFKEDILGVKQLGMVPYDQMPNIFRQCHVLVHPTLEDGNPLSLHEAMASGLVPISTPVVSEVYKDEVSGITVPYRNPKAIVEALTMLKNNPERRREMAREARAKAEKDTWQKTKEELKRIIGIQT